MEAYPFDFASAPPGVSTKDKVGVSFVIGHRGTERLPQLLRTLETIAAQRGVAVECLVVEQSVSKEIRDSLPSWVRYIHTPLPEPDMAYARGWALNVGARRARGGLLVLHDGDLLVPRDYAREHLNLARSGYEVINLKRFIFYLDNADTDRVISDRTLLNAAVLPDQILQNAQGGGSLVITRSAFLELGGFDEEFIGWGGEDTEFWERAQSRRVYPYSYLPLIHLWHPPQSGRREVRGCGLDTVALSEARRSIPPLSRIAELSKRGFGDTAGPATR